MANHAFRCFLGRGGQLAGISFALAVVNIVCMYLFGLAVFWLKEVLPHDPNSYRLNQLRKNRSEMWKIEEELEAGDLSRLFDEHPNVPPPVKMLLASSVGYAPDGKKGIARSRTTMTGLHAVGNIAGGVVQRLSGPFTNSTPLSVLAKDFRLRRSCTMGLVFLLSHPI